MKVSPNCDAVEGKEVGEDFESRKGSKGNESQVTISNKFVKKEEILVPSFKMWNEEDDEEGEAQITMKERDTGRMNKNRKGDLWPICAKILIIRRVGKGNTGASIQGGYFKFCVCKRHELAKTEIVRKKQQITKNNKKLRSWKVEFATLKSAASSCDDDPVKAGSKGKEEKNEVLDTKTKKAKLQLPPWKLDFSETMEKCQNQL
ncbi:hypothetical protein Glove_493g42 [Diversispora epigaea]|uniref:Uncharacterized protein n=1 Tax=Diversispora epigaea TaxID=1348612 RepID=A0A397GI99_9GLOM|nr:hypothetical protein Glove_493g42 [Diversispora epigaea]